MEALGRVRWIQFQVVVHRELVLEPGEPDLLRDEPGRAQLDEARDRNPLRVATAQRQRPDRDARGPARGGTLRDAVHGERRGRRADPRRGVRRWHHMAAGWTAPRHDPKGVKGVRCRHAGAAGRLLACLLRIRFFRVAGLPRDPPRVVRLDPLDLHHETRSCHLGSVQRDRPSSDGLVRSGHRARRRFARGRWRTRKRDRGGGQSIRRGLRSAPDARRGSMASRDRLCPTLS